MLSVPELRDYSFHFAGWLDVSHMQAREYVARKDGESVDRFHVFFAGGEWNAWTADSLSETTIRIRRTFAATLIGSDPATTSPPAV
jgi:hypothetical protein